MAHIRNSFRIQFWNVEERSVKLPYVDYIVTATKWMDKNNIEWTHAMVYDRKTGDKIERIINEKVIQNRN